MRHEIYSIPEELKIEPNSDSSISKIAKTTEPGTKIYAMNQSDFLRVREPIIKTSKISDENQFNSFLVHTASYTVKKMTPEDHEEKRVLREAKAIVMEKVLEAVRGSANCGCLHCRQEEANMLEWFSKDGTIGNNDNS